jgi:membrane protein DedA with SNARE-associated domain
VESLVGDYGLFLLFLLVAMESAGIPLPGETALVAAAVLAARGDMDIVAVIAVAAIAAIVGDNIGYWAGRLGGRKLLQRWGPLERHASRVLPWSERFFERHGGKTIFLGRFIAVLRVTAAWVAGISKMHWWLFFLWNAAGGIVWAVTVGLVAYYAGQAAADAIAHYGLIGGGAIVVVLVVGAIVFRFVRRRMLGAESEGEAG